jgi:hypothetical protein
MKKILTSATIIGLTGLALFSCINKNNDNITPTYRNQSTGTGANPNINVVTVTGHQTVGDPATQNSSFQVAGSMLGWSFEGCGSHPNMFVTSNGSTTIRIIFNGPITAGTFALTSSTPNAGQAQMIITSAPGQPNDISWYSKGGTITVTPFGSGYSATFSNIQCTQQNYIFPVVTISGGVSC